MMNSTAEKERLGGFIAFIERTTGITIPDTDYRILGDSVKDRASSLGLSPGAYLERLGNDGRELERFLNRVTIGETYFFREERHFRALKDGVFPELRERGEKVSIWSATCSSGEEAYSLAAFALAYLKSQFTVYATDLNSDSLDILKRGIYSKNSFREDGGAYRDIIMQHADRDGGHVAIRRELRDLVEPLRVNLFADSLDQLPADIDLIFFRNTLIYMKTEIKAKLVERLAGKLAPGGYLFLASSEMPLIMNRKLALRETSGAYYFEREPRSSEPSHATGAVPSAAASISAPRAMPEKASMPPQLRLDDREIFRAAALFEANPRGESDDRDPVQFLARLLLYALYFINHGKSSLAREVIAVIEKYHESGATWHLRGLLDLMEGGTGGATASFRKALALDARFWPARFYLASATKESDAAGALADFEKCRRELATLPASDAALYRVFLEGFSEKYFLEICENMIRTLGKKDRDGK